METSKLNRSAIFSNAHKIAKSIRAEFKTYAQALSYGLKQAYAAAKNTVETTYNSLKELVEATISSEGLRAKYWEGGANKRLYINSGWNTRKCKQSIYIDLSTFEVKCFTECPGQSWNWIKSQNAQRVSQFTPLAERLRTAVERI